MKKFICFLTVVLFSGILSAQVVYDAESGTAQMSNVLSLDSLSKDELFSRAKIWVAMYLKSSDKHSFYDEEKKELITVTGNSVLKDQYYSTQRYFNFKLSLYFKEGKCKYVINEMIYSEYLKSWLSGRESTRNVILDEEYQKAHNKKKDIKKTKLYVELDELLIEMMSKLEKYLRKGDNSKNDW